MKLKQLFLRAIEIDYANALISVLSDIEKAIDDELVYPEDSIEFDLEHPRIGKINISIGSTETNKGDLLQIWIRTGSGSSNYFSVVSVIKELRIRS